MRDYAAAAACDLDAYGAWCRALLELGVYPPASQFEAWFPSLAHSHSDVERTVAAAADAFGESDERSSAHTTGLAGERAAAPRRCSRR